jgi:molybdopterin-binding protein
MNKEAGRCTAERRYRATGSMILCERIQTMPLSARNQLPGVVEGIQIGDIMAHVSVRVGENVIESIITRNSAEDLGLKKGDSVRVVVKSTEVMIQKD